LGGEELKKSILVLILFGIGLFTQLPIISAQESEIQQEEDHLRIAEQAYTFGNDSNIDTPMSGSSIWAIVRMLLMLAIVAIAIYGIVFFLKKKTSGQNAEKDPFLKILASSHLGNNRYAHIVSVGNKAWLLGSSDGGVNLIGEIEDKELIDTMILEDAQKSTDAPSGKFPDFMSLLRKLGVPADNRSMDTEELRKRRERLKGM
jgi:flagellar protein FliO/FliZ